MIRFLQSSSPVAASIQFVLDHLKLRFQIALTFADNLYILLDILRRDGLLF